MPTIANHILDIPLEYYRSCGVSPKHNYPPFNISDVKEGDIIFVKTDYIVTGQFGSIVDKIKVPFNLISGVSSYNVGRDGGDVYKKVLECDNLIKWVCTNPPSVESEKIIPIPIGFPENERESGNQEFLKKCHALRKPFEDKKNKIYLPYHNFTTNPYRKNQFEDFEKCDLVDSQREKVGVKEYYEKLNDYKYIVCFQGRGPDIFRIYESFLVGSVPIVVDNPTIYKVLDYYDLNYIRCDSIGSMESAVESHLNNKEYTTDKNDQFLKLENLKNKVLRNLNK